MARRKRKQVNRQVKERRILNATVARIVRSEPVIRVFDNRNLYQRKVLERAAKRRIALRKEFDRINAPRRFNRRVRAEVISQAFGLETYHKLHNCKQEWRKLLSWRSGQGSGRKRSQNELRNSKLSFIKKDC